MQHQVDANERAVASEISRLQLENVETEWVTQVMDSDFLQYQDLPLEYEEILNECNINSRLTNIRKALLRWLEVNHRTPEDGEASTSQVRQSLGSSQTSENMSTATNSHTSNKGAQFWGFLFQTEKINVQCLLALIGYFIDRGSTLASSSEERQRCFEAAKLYFTLICIPGSMAFRVYHQMLFTKTLQLIQLYVQTRKYQKTSTSQPTKKGHSQKQQSQQVAELEEEEEEAPISAEDISSIEKAMPSYLDSLFLVSQHLSFKRYPNILKETVECILPIISLDRGTVSLKALEITQNFCNPLHGDTIQTVHHVFAHILPYLALDPNEKDFNNKNLVALKDASFNLVSNFKTKFGEVIYPLIQGLIKHVCIDVVDRAEYRQKTAQTALDLLELIPEEHQQGTVRWFLLLAHTEQTFLRLFSMEVLSLFLHNGRIDFLSFAVIFSQCSDVSATVRAKALSILGDCIESNDRSIVEIFDLIFSEEVDRADGEEEQEIDILEILQGEEPINATSALLPKASAIMNLLKERAVDDKVHVRKNALQLILSVTRRHGRYLNQELLCLLGSACRDSAMLIRRHMAQVLTDMMYEHPENEGVQRIWTRSVLPLVLDGETRVQEKALECADQLILQSLTGQDSERGWSLLDVIIELGLDIYLSKAVEMWSRQQQIPAHLLRTLLSNTEQRSKASLTLIAIFARHATIDNNIKKFAVDYLQDHMGITNPVTVYCIQQVYKIVGSCLHNMNKDYVQTVRTISSRFVSNFHLPTNLIATACDTVVFCIQQQFEDESDARKEAALWAGNVLSSCGEFLSNHLRKQENVLADEEEQLARRILTVGCAALHSPHEVNKRHFLLLQHAAFQPESGVDAPIPFSQPQSQPTRKLPPRLQAAAVVSLGKLSVQHEEMAKQLIPGFGRLLETTPHEAVRNNIVCILCDWVVRYATAIDPVMPQVTACLRDPTPDVRKQTLVLLIHLLQEDYLKIRGTFFFRILQLANDDDEGLRDLAHFYVTQRLLHRQPTIIQQHFIECVFHFNDYKGHPTYNKFVLTDRERTLFSISGQQHARRRFQIYQFMLQNLDDEARFQLTFRLTRDVLHGVVEDVMSLRNASTEAVLKDALAVLSSDDIKLASLAASTDDDPVEREDIAQAIVQSAKKAIIAQVVKRNVIENIVPIVVALKRKLATSKSPLMGNLMQFLRELMKDYTDEIQEILAEDKQLMAEIDFDLKRFEQQEREEAAAPQNAAPRTDRSLAPIPPELANLEAIRPQTDRRSRVSQRVILPDQTNRTMTNADEKSSDKTLLENTGKTSTNDKTLEEPVESNENSPVNEEPQSPTTEPAKSENVNNCKSSPTKELQTQDMDMDMEQQLPVAQASLSSPDLPPPPSRNLPKNRLLRSRIMSTPIRSVPVDEVSFQIRDADISDIPRPDLETRKRRRRT